MDNVWRALLDKLERKGSVYIYLYESHDKNFNKYGISKKPRDRAKNGGYGEKLIEPRFYPERRDGVLVEQAFKYGYGSDIPKTLEDWVGNTELTNLSPREFEEIIDELDAMLIELGRWDFAEEYCDPAEIKRAKKELGEVDT